MLMNSLPPSKASLRRGSMRHSSMTSEDSRAPRNTPLCDPDPHSKQGQKWQLIQMMLLPLLPMIGIFIQSSIRFGLSLNTLYTIDQSKQVLELGHSATRLIEAFQEERTGVILFITNATAQLKPLTQRYNNTDTKLKEFHSWPMVNSDIVSFYSRRTFAMLLQQHREDLSKDPITEIEFYNGAIDAFVNWLILEVDFTKGGTLWTYLMTYKELIKCGNRISIQVALGKVYFTQGRLKFKEHSLFIRSRRVAVDLLATSSIYDASIDTLIQNYYASNPKLSQNIKKMTADIVHNKAISPDVTSGATWLMNMTDYLKTIRRIDEIQIGKIGERLNEVYTKQEGQCIGEGFLAILTLLLTPILCLLSSKTTKAVQIYTNCLVLKKADMVAEKKRTEELLYQMIPKQVALQMKQNKKVEAEYFENVTVFFSDIVNFKEVSDISTPMQIVRVLNDTYIQIDANIERYDVYKVETISDVYMISSGVPTRNGDQHVFEIANLALDLMESMKYFKIPHLREELLQLRIGINTGPCVAGVVGEAMPRYCLFGDTVNVAARMQTNSLPLKIHITKETRDALSANNEYVMPYRGKLQVKGKGEMSTYWLAEREKNAGYEVQFKFFNEF